VKSALERSLQQMIHRFRQVGEASLRQLPGLLPARLPAPRIAFNKNRPHPQPFSKLNIRKRISDNHARFSCNFREVLPRLVKQSGQRLAAIAGPFVMRTKIKPIHMRALGCQRILQIAVDRLHIGHRVLSQGDAPLIGHNNHAQSNLIQPGNRRLNPGQQRKSFPARNVLTLRHLAVDHPVTIKKYRPQWLALV